MSANSKTFSTAKLRCTSTALELHFLDDPAGTTASLEGGLALGCSEPKCLSGTDPFGDGNAFQLDMEIRMTPGSTTQASLLATTVGMGGTWVPVPVLDPSYAVLCKEDPCPHDHSHPAVCGGLCQELRTRRAAAQLPLETRFYVYRVTRTPAALAALLGKLI